MHIDLDKLIARRLNELPDQGVEPGPRAELSQGAELAQGAEPYGWDEFRRRARLRGAARKRFGQAATAAAAVLLMLVVGAVIWSHMRRPPLASRLMPIAPLVPDARASTNVEAAKRWLAAAPSEPVVVRFGTRVAVFGLEDRIAQVDDLLTAANVTEEPPADIAALHEERDRLVSSLAQVRYAETLVAESH